jgi:hypothetical protein
VGTLQEQLQRHHEQRCLEMEQSVATSSAYTSTAQDNFGNATYATAVRHASEVRKHTEGANAAQAGHAAEIDKRAQQANEAQAEHAAAIDNNAQQANEAPEKLAKARSSHKQKMSELRGKYQSMCKFSSERAINAEKQLRSSRSEAHLLFQKTEKLGR